MEPEAFQREIDATAASDYEAFRGAGPDMPDTARLAAYAARPALRLYDEAIDAVFAEAAATVVTGSPAVWLVYNAGVVVKTPRCLFAIDLAHRKDVRFATSLDFALVTHNHGDHVSPAFLKAMDSQGKTVVSNFFDNYGAHRGGRMPGGYAPDRKTLSLGDVTVRTALSDHNPYLEDFTTAFEVTAGGWTLYHTGDSQNLDKLRPSRPPDLWIVHPRCGLDVAAGVRKFHPAKTVIAHLFELGHTRWRWGLAEGREDAARAVEAGSEAVVPFWGQRIQ